MKKILYLINPKSGTKNKLKLNEKIKKFSKNTKPEIRFTEYAGHAIEICKHEHKNYDAIVVAGGDGSVNELAQGLVGTDTALGVLPFGSGNGFSNALNIPENTIKAIKIIDNFNIKIIDLAKINGHIFDNVVGIGFDAFIAHKFDVAGKRGFVSYLKIILKEFKKYQPIKYKIKIDDKDEIELKSFLLSVANGKQWGNNFEIAPKASFTDGKLDITAMNKFSLFSASSIAYRLYFNTIHKSKLVKTYTCKTISIKKQGEIYAHIDGDPIIFNNEINIEILPKSIKVIIP